VENEIVVTLPDLSRVCLKLWGRMPLALSLVHNDRVILEGTDVDIIVERFMRMVREAVEKLMEGME